MIKNTSNYIRSLNTSSLSNSNRSLKKDNHPLLNNRNDFIISNRAALFNFDRAVSQGKVVILLWFN